MIYKNVFMAVLLTAFAVFSQQINISGVVKDSASASPVSGAEVRLAIAGFKDTTKEDGTFLLKGLITSTIGLTGPGFSTAPVFSARGIMAFSVASRVQVTLHTYSPSGRLVHRLAETVEAGRHTINLPRSSAGLLIHRITIGGTTYTHRTVSTHMGSVNSSDATGKEYISQSPTLLSHAERGFSDTLIVMFKEIEIHRMVITQPLISDLEIIRPVFFTITYSGNGNTGGSVPTSQIKTHGVALTLATNIGNLVRAGYIFAGWNTAANGTGTHYDAGGSYTADQSVTLYAKWTISGGTVTDIEGNVYTTIIIGTQEWTVENWRSTKYNDGTAIPHVTDNAAWAALTTPGYCYYSNATHADTIKKWGALYNWYVVSPTNLKKIAPAGWHVPTDAEWDTLQNYLIANGYNWDGTTTGNKIAKSMAAKTDWQTSSTGGAPGNSPSTNNSSGFSALPGGFRNFTNGSFLSVGYDGCWWSATEDVASEAWRRRLHFNYEDQSRSRNNKRCGFSVRLLRDSVRPE